MMGSKVLEARQVPLQDLDHQLRLATLIFWGQQGAQGRLQRLFSRGGDAQANRFRRTFSIDRFGQSLDPQQLEWLSDELERGANEPFGEVAYGRGEICVASLAFC